MMPIQFLCAVVFALLAAWFGPAAAAGGALTELSITGPIGPAGADYIVRGIARAAQQGSVLVVIRIDTPGGLDTSMREIIRAILASPVPVASYVAPGGARAASAGLYILYASHVAAMAPGTNLGAATPVQVGIGTGRTSDDTAPMARKQVNDAAAYIRSLAQMRGRNADWGERAVRDAASLPAQEALKLQVIDLVAPDIGALADQLDGKTVNVQGLSKVLHTKGAQIVRIVPDWRVRLLAAITDPGIALILMMLGIYGLIFELMNPGTALPGVTGAICLLLAMYALQLLPVNYAGLALILLGVAFMIAEAFLPSFGALGLGGVIAFSAGALILIDTDLPGFGVPVALVVPLALGSAVLLAAMVGIALRTRRRAITGDLVGKVGEVQHSTHGRWIRVHGENWQVRSASPLSAGQRVRVVARDGLVLDVEPANHNKKGAP